ncbi:hypothetical protein D3C75_690620 [compost metagenome]
MLEDQREWANADVFHIITQQAWIGVRNDQADNQNREHIEQQDTPEHLTNRAWNIFAWIFRFTRRNTDKLSPLERETDYHRHAYHRREATRKWRIANCPVTPARRLCTFKDAQNHHHADGDKHHHGDDFNQ